MSILVAYATVEGQTRKIAEHIAARLEQAGATVVVGDVGQAGFAEPGSYQAAILCAPIHIGRYPERMVRFIEDWKEVLDAMPTALVTVSLAIASAYEEEQAEARACPRKLERKTGWTAGVEHNAAGALKYVEYDFFRRWVMRRIAEKEGGPVDVSKDHELTDWAALDAFTDSFVASLRTAN